VKATTLLENDHRTVSALFKQLEETEEDKSKVAIAQQICTELTVHATVEERLFYPAAREALDEEDLVDEATVEHRTLKLLIADIDGSSAGDVLFDANMKVLKEYVEHHVKEEEQQMFPRLEGKLDLEALGARMADLKAELLAKAGERKPPRAGAKAAVHVPSVSGRNGSTPKSKGAAAKSPAKATAKSPAKATAKGPAKAASKPHKTRSTGHVARTTSRSASHSA